MTVDLTDRRFTKVWEHSSQRLHLRELLWKIYEDPQKVLAAIAALEDILTGPNPNKKENV